MPDFPGTSSAAPALYQTIWVTVGGAMVGNDDDLEAVVEREGADVRRDLMRPGSLGAAHKRRRDRRRDQHDGDPGQSRKVHRAPWEAARPAADATRFYGRSMA